MGKWGPYVVTAFVLVSFACTSTADDFRSDVFACEEAVSWLATCCPGFVPESVSCEYDHYKSCGHNVTTTPALVIAESECVRAHDCDYLRANGVCDRAQGARANVDCYGDACTPNESHTGSLVCP